MKSYYQYIVTITNLSNVRSISKHIYIDEIKNMAESFAMATEVSGDIVGEAFEALNESTNETSFEVHTKLEYIGMIEVPDGQALAESNLEGCYVVSATVPRLNDDGPATRKDS